MFGGVNIHHIRTVFNLSHLLIKKKLSSPTQDLAASGLNNKIITPRTTLKPIPKHHTYIHAKGTVRISWRQYLFPPYIAYFVGLLSDCFTCGLQWPQIWCPHRIRRTCQCQASNKTGTRQTGGLMFSLIYTWTNSWVNYRDTGDLRRRRTHYDVIVMLWQTVTAKNQGPLFVSACHNVQQEPRATG